MTVIRVDSLSRYRQALLLTYRGRVEKHPMNQVANQGDRDGNE